MTGGSRLVRSEQPFAENYRLMKINDTQFSLLKQLVHRESGINLEGKPQLVETRLAKRFRKIGPMSIDDYICLLQTDPVELTSFVDIIATTHTFFFRENKTFAYLDRQRSRSIWCAACASGEEPYSIIIHCLEQGFLPEVLATDISSEILLKAERGVYTQDRLRHMSESLVNRYFMPEKVAGTTRYKIKPRVRNAVVFDRSNLLTDDVPERKFDVIFCRNVMIYFDLPTKEKIVEKMYYALKPGGYFIIGGAESLSIVEHKFTFVSPSVYQR
ncbi:MAG: protein-glutamate O-methyltransferase CheR [Desulfosudaceae bacterium]